MGLVSSSRTRFMWQTACKDIAFCVETCPLYQRRKDGKSTNLSKVSRFWTPSKLRIELTSRTLFSTAGDAQLKHRIKEHAAKLIAFYARLRTAVSLEGCPRGQPFDNYQRTFDGMRERSSETALPLAEARLTHRSSYVYQQLVSPAPQPQYFFVLYGVTWPLIIVMGPRLLSPS